MPFSLSVEHNIFWRPKWSSSRPFPLPLGIYMMYNMTEFWNKMHCENKIYYYLTSNQADKWLQYSQPNRGYIEVLSHVLWDCGMKILSKADWLKTITCNYTLILFLVPLNFCMKHLMNMPINSHNWVIWPLHISSKYAIDLQNGPDTTDKVCLNISTHKVWNVFWNQ